MTVESAHTEMPTSVALGIGKRPTLLYLTFNVGFINPTRELLCDVLRGAAKATFYGPGYQGPDVLNKGIEAFVSKNGPFDFIMTDETAIENFDILDQGGELRFVNHACRFDRSLLRMGRDYQRFLKTYGGRRIVALLQSDYYNFPQQRIDAIESIGDYFLSWGPEFLLSNSDADTSGMLLNGINSRSFHRGNDRYLNFITRHMNNVISCPHFLCDAELFDSRLIDRPNEWSVLGADYDARVTARELLNGANVGWGGNWIRYIFAGAQKVRFNVHDKYWTISFLNWAFHNALRRSKYSYTCGGYLNWPIRKYLEIPASGCVIVCEKSNGFSDLGFLDRTNAIVCRAADILDAHSWLKSDPDRAQRIADAGRELVTRQHSVDARARQIGAALERIMQGRFHGSRWRGGAFELSDA